ncbi:MAG: hypothetical protein E2604_07125 [Flavobacterium sp.]|nr:hypothetical protein [Flavobacterium sp.]
MNRIILIGNGFDLAHNIKTSYSHFIKNYWEKVIQDLKNEVSYNYTTHRRVFENNEIKINNVPGFWELGYWVKAEKYEDLIVLLDNLNLELIFKNRFLEILIQKHTEQNWVDIENEYYRLLKMSFKNNNCTYKIEELNNDFNQIKNLLESYLCEVEENFNANFGTQVSDIHLRRNIGNKIYSPFQLKDFTETSINKKAEIEYQKIYKILDVLNYPVNDDTDITLELNEKIQKIISKLGNHPTIKDIRKLLISDSAINYFELIPDEILFLNFNYTFIEKIYSDYSQFDLYDSKKIVTKQYIHIHGTTNKNDHNDVIFGFGDEIDEDYKSIENLNDNTYLENIKSIKYLETDNYKQLLEFLNSGSYQIFIFGHSCGNSDRTLLNTLFEHKNCASIKPYYHLKENGSDNYSDIIRNISRNFNSKAVMRDKVVNKLYCESLS